MRRLPPPLFAIALLPTPGCGDSLVSGPALDLLLGKQPFPEDPRWLHLWVDEGAEGVLVSCELSRPAGGVDEDDTVQLDQVWVPAPDWAEPAAWTVEEDFRWALSLHLVVDGDTFDFDRAAEAFDETEQDAEDLIGVWGMADSVARLHGEGDMGLLGETIVAGEVPPELDADGRAWVGFAQEIVAATGTFQGAVTALDPEDQAILNADGIPVRRLSSLDQASQALLFGQPFGGVEVVGDCLDGYEEDEEFEEYEEDAETTAFLASIRRTTP